MNIIEARKFINTCVRIDPKCHSGSAWTRGWLIGVDRTDGIVKPKGHKHEIHIDLKYLQPWKKGVGMNDPEKAERLFSDTDKKENQMIKHYVVRYLSMKTGDYSYFTINKKFLQVPHYKHKEMLDIKASFGINFYDKIPNATRSAKKTLASASRNLAEVEVYCIEDDCVVSKFSKTGEPVQEPVAQIPIAAEPPTEPFTGENFGDIVAEVKMNKGLSQLLELYVAQRKAVLLVKEMAHEEELKLLKIEADIDIAMMTNKLLEK